MISAISHLFYVFFVNDIENHTSNFLNFDFRAHFSVELANEYLIADNDRLYKSLRFKSNALAQMSISLDKLVSKTPKSSVCKNDVSLNGLI